MPIRPLIVAACVASLAVACGSSDNPSDPTGSGGSATGSGGSRSTGSAIGGSTGSGGPPAPEMSPFAQRFSQSDRETAEAVAMLPDGVVIVGDTAPGADDEAWIMKLDTEGQVAWEHLVGGPSGEGYTDVVVDGNGNIVAIGDLGVGLGAGFVHRFSPTGQLLDQKIFGAGDGESFDAIIAHDGGYYIAGGAQGMSTDAMLVKLDQNLGVVWQKTLGGSGSDNFYALAPLPSGGVVVTGARMGDDLDIDAVISAVNADGSEAWTHVWGADGIDQAWSVTTTDNAIFVGGRTSSFGLGDADGLIMRISLEGELLWAQTVGTETGELIYDIEVDGRGNLAFSGRSGDFDLSYGWLGGFDVTTGSATFGTRFAPEGYQVFDSLQVVGERLVAVGFTEVDDDDGDSDFIVVSTNAQGEVDGGCGTAEAVMLTTGDALANLTSDATLSWSDHGAPMADSEMVLSTSGGTASNGCE